MSYWYLATPYTKFPGGLDEAFLQACDISGKLLRQGVSVLSPIVQGHPIAMACHLDPLDHSIWLPMNDAMMAGAWGMLVAEMIGWDTSVGIKAEIAKFLADDKPIYNVDPLTPMIIRSKQNANKPPIFPW